MLCNADVMISFAICCHLYSSLIIVYAAKLERDLDASYDRYLSETKNAEAKQGTRHAKRTKKAKVRGVLAFTIIHMSCHSYCPCWSNQLTGHTQPWRRKGVSFVMITKHITDYHVNNAGCSSS